MSTKRLFCRHRGVIALPVQPPCLLILLYFRKVFVSLDPSPDKPELKIEARPGATDCQLSDSGLLIGIRW